MHKFAVKTIKSMIRDYGVAVSWHRLDSATVDLDTGNILEVTKEFKIKKAILMSETLTRKFSYDLSYIAANKNFVYGGFFDEGEGSMIFLSKDLPTGRDLNDYIIVNSEHFIVKAILIHPLGFVGVNFKHIVGNDAP